LTSLHKGERFVTDNGAILLAYTDWASRMAPQASDFWANNMFNLFTTFKKPNAKGLIADGFDSSKLDYKT